MRRLLIAPVLVASSLVLAAQQARDAPTVSTAGTAQISGRVSTAETAPVRRAIVVITGDRANRLVAVTDDSGRFAFTSLPADRYTLSVSKAGYVPSNYGSKRPGGSGTPIVVADGQRSNIAMVLLKGSVITGTVRDQSGRPLPEVTVTAQRYAISTQTGERTLQSVTIGSAGALVQNYSPDAFPGTGRTDDRGEYRIFGLAPGEYVVSASARGSVRSPLTGFDVHQTTAADVQRAERLLRGASAGAAGDPAASTGDRADTSRVDFVPVYHPSALSAADAATIVLGPAEERSGVDVLLRLVPTARVSGVVTAPDGSPLVNAQVSLLALPRSASAGVSRATRTNLDGEYSIAGVPPGRYEVQGSAYPEAFFGSTEILIDGRDVPLSFVLPPSVTVSGRIVFEGATRHPAPSETRLFLTRQLFTASSTSYQIKEDGTFVFSRVAPGPSRLNINGPPPAGWVLRSAMLNGLDVSDVTFEIKSGENIDGIVITLTDRPAEISGVLQTAEGAPAPDYVLVVFSADPRFRVARSRRTQHVRPDINGRFIIRDLPAGDYLISAVIDLEDGQWNDPEFLKELAASAPIKISVAEGEKKVQDIRIGRFEVSGFILGAGREQD